MGAELAPTPLCCSFCRSTPQIALCGDRPIMEQLIELACPTCHRLGPLQLSAFPKPQRVGLHEAPNDDIGDEELLERRIRQRDWRF